MSEHVIDDHGHHAGHGGDAHHDDHNSPEHIRKEVRLYIGVFIALGVLTAVTVAAAYLLHLPFGLTVLVALAIASVKGFLVAGYFMHLLSEKKLIYAILLLTVFFFAVLMWGPWHHFVDTFNKH